MNWDDKLTLEFNGDAPQLSELIIEKVNNVPTVFLCGNSTVVDQDNEPWASWGQMIPRFFNDSICFANYAESGESANTFIGAGRLKKALTQMKPGDYIFMEFGHNDQKQKGPGKGAYYSFMTSLKTFIDEARARGAYPVLVTPTQRRSFDENGKIRDTHEDYPEAMRWLAAKENVPLIDLNEMTRTLYEAMGVEPSKKAFVHYPAGTYPGQNRVLADNTHFNPYGAYQISKCIIEGIKKAGLPIANYLRSDYSGYSILPPADFDGMSALLYGLHKEEMCLFWHDSKLHRGLVLPSADMPEPVSTTKVLGGNLGIRMGAFPTLPPFFSPYYFYHLVLLLKPQIDFTL